MDINLREITSSAVLEEKKKLRKEFRYLDMIFYTLAALIGLDTVGAFAANGLLFAYALFTVIFILVPTSTGKVDRLTYELTQFIPLALIVLLTIIFYILGHNDKRNQDVFFELSIGEAGVGSAGSISGE